MQGTFYMIACLVLPAIWGLMVSVLYDRLAERRPQPSHDQEDKTEMYHI